MKHRCFASSKNADAEKPGRQGEKCRNGYGEDSAESEASVPSGTVVRPFEKSVKQYPAASGFHDAV